MVNEDYLSQAKVDGGLELGTMVTSTIFLAAILATVTYLAITKKRRDCLQSYFGQIAYNFGNVHYMNDLVVFGAQYLYLLELAAAATYFLLQPKAKSRSIEWII